MKQNTNNPEITITRDGLPTNEFQPTIADAAVSHVQAATAVLASKLGEYATELYMPAYLEAQDAKLGTNLRAEYFQRKRELAIAALRDEVGL